MNAVYIYDSPGEKRVLVRGHVGQWFRDQRVPAYRVNIENGWHLHRERLDDVLARMDRSGLVVRYVQGPAPRHVPRLSKETAA